MDNKTAVKMWKDFVYGCVPMIIMDKPDDFENPLPVVVVPEQDQNFLIAEFSTSEAAENFCRANNLPVAKNNVAEPASPQM